MPRMVALLAVTVVLVTGLIVSPGALAQEQTPSAADVPSSEECQIEPRTLGSLLEFVGTPVPDREGDAEPTPFVPPPGEPADEETVAAITATMREFVACANAGEFLRAFALFSDDFFRRLAAEEDLTAEDLNELDTPPTPESEEDRLGVILWDARVLPDGRVGAFVVVAEVGDTDEPDFAIFVQEGDRWLIDEVIEDIGETMTTPES